MNSSCAVNKVPAQNEMLRAMLWISRSALFRIARAGYRIAGAPYEAFWAYSWQRALLSLLLFRSRPMAKEPG